MFVIDTNTKEYNESRISISCSAFFQIDLKPYNFIKGEAYQDWHAKVKMQSAFIFRNPTVNPELIGWCELIDRIKKTPEFKNTLKIGIIVDSELDKLSQINRREIPILDPHFIPDNFQLIYASSDSGMEYPHNKLLKICDITGNKIWDSELLRKEIMGSMKNLDNIFMDGSTILHSEVVHELSLQS